MQNNITFIEYIPLKDLVCFKQNDKVWYTKASTILKQGSVFPITFQKIVADAINKRG